MSVHCCKVAGVETPCHPPLCSDILYTAYLRTEATDPVLFSVSGAITALIHVDDDDQ